MFRLITNWFPVWFRNKFNTIVTYSRIKVKKESFLGFLSVVSIILSIILSLLLKLIFDTGLILVFLIILFVINISVYFVFILKADSVARFIENVLPDALQLMTSNLRAGLTTDKALLLAARPEFSALSEELNNVGRKLALGEDIGKALLDMTNKFKSDKLKKAILLIVAGLKSGGELTELLDQVASNLRQSRFVDEKIRTNVLMYVIFIFIAIGIGAPVLYGLSSFLITVIQENLAGIEIPESTIIPITFSKTKISTSFILTFGIISLMTTAIMGSFVLGLIGQGKEKRGVKFIPFLLLLSLSIYFLARYLIRIILTGVFGL